MAPAKKKAKKKAKKQGQGGGGAPAGDGRLNAPFAGLKARLARAAPAVPAGPPAAERAGGPGPEAQPPAEDEAAAFRRAMSDVAPLEAGRRAVEPRRPEPKRPRLEEPLDEELEVLAQLSDLISGQAELDLRYTSQFVWGAAEGVGPELMARLEAGEFPVQDYLDLHGHSLDEALEAAERFLTSCQTRGLRHVLIVHGKGSGSPEGLPVLKSALARALTHKRLGRKVLAFCTARPGDGGAGAMYVLLRKWRGPWGNR
jgi:DNA-nicking Smr family endonuclease